MTTLDLNETEDYNIIMPTLDLNETEKQAIKDMMAEAAYVFSQTLRYRYDDIKSMTVDEDFANEYINIMKMHDTLMKLLFSLSIQKNPSCSAMEFWNEKSSVREWVFNELGAWLEKPLARKIKRYLKEYK